MDWKDIGVFAGLAVTLILGVSNLMWNVKYNRRTTFINTVTSERVKWITKLRDNLSRFLGLTHSWMGLRSEASPKIDEMKNEIDVLRYEIKLQLNPIDQPDITIIEKIDEIPDLVCKPDVTPALSAMNQLVSLGQSLLGAEWRKVKREAMKGAFADAPKLLERSPLHRRLLRNYVTVALVLGGLVLTTIGAAWAAVSGIMNKQTATELATTKWEFNSELRRSLIRQSRDTRNGLILIVLGSGLQFAGAALQITRSSTRL